MTDDQEWAILTARVPFDLLERLLDEAEAAGVPFDDVVVALLTSGLPEEPSETVTLEAVRSEVVSTLTLTRSEQHRALAFDAIADLVFPPPSRGIGRPSSLAPRRIGRPAAEVDG